MRRQDDAVWEELVRVYHPRKEVSVRIELRAVEGPEGCELLASLENRMFLNADQYTAEDFIGHLCWVLELDGELAGSIALLPDAKVDENGEASLEEGTLYIAGTGVLPKWQRKGLGMYLKTFQIAYARLHGFRRMSTVCRSNNVPILALNRKLGFRRRGRIKDYYSGPKDDGVILALSLVQPQGDA